MAPQPFRPAGGQVAIAAWRRTKDGTVAERFYAPIVIYKTGRPSISYINLTGLYDGDLMYGVYDGLQWNTEIVPTASDVMASGLAFDSNGNPNISYYSFPDGGVFLATTTATPEPSTLVLLAISTIRPLGYAWRRRKRAG